MHSTGTLSKSGSFIRTKAPLVPMFVNSPVLQGWANVRSKTGRFMLKRSLVRRSVGRDVGVSPRLGGCIILLFTFKSRCALRPCHVPTAPTGVVADGLCQHEASMDWRQESKQPKASRLYEEIAEGPNDSRRLRKGE